MALGSARAAALGRRILSLRMGVVGHSYGGTGMGEVAGVHVGKARRGLSHVSRCRSTSRVRGYGSRSRCLPGSQG